SSNCPTSTFVYAGIFYASGSSGTVNEVETRNQNCNGIYGFGILAENGAGATQLVTIENSNINSNSYAGITAGSDQTPSTLTASIKSNYVAGGVVGIYTALNVGGSVSGNVVGASGAGVIASSPSSLVSKNTVNGGSEGIEVDGAVTVSGNTINGATYGVFVKAAGSVTSNNISNSGYGIYFQVNGATIKTNIITQAPVGIEFGCYRHRERQHHQRRYDRNRQGPGWLCRSEQVPQCGDGYNRWVRRLWATGAGVCDGRT